MRVSLGLVCLILIAGGAYDRFYADASDVLYVPGPPFTFIPDLGTGFLALRAVCVVAGLAFTVGLLSRWSTPVFAGTFALLNFYVARFDAGIWSYNTHLVFFLVALCFTDHARFLSLDALHSRGAPRAAALPAPFTLAFMQGAAATIYLQAGISKLVNSGPGWYLEGEAIRIYALRIGTEFGHALAQEHWLFPFFGIATAVVEFGLAGLFLFRAHVLFAIIAIAFHLSTGLVFGITFWFLWTLYPALFLWKHRAAA